MDPNKLAPSGNAELDGLASQVAQADAAAAGATATSSPGEPQLEEGTNYALEAAKATDTLAALFVGYCPATAAVWTPEKKAGVQAALEPVMEKYEFSMDAMPCELVLLIIAGPPLYQTVKLMAAQRIQEQQQVQNATAGESQPAMATGQPEESTGPGVHPQVKLYGRKPG